MSSDSREGRNRIRRRIEQDVLLVNQVLDHVFRLFNKEGLVELEEPLDGPHGKIAAIETPALRRLREAARALEKHRAAREA